MRSRCLPCEIAHRTGYHSIHDECLGRGKDAARTCGCLCPWLLKEMNDDPDPV